ncbi:MAG TPA: MBL fold metallo-hydrolase [Candidatus Bathyarchaeia archaeon]|nr:MBL fold metallo-hydrolase [Candidatus Bathyarchaeia archaeon]
MLKRICLGLGGVLAAVVVAALVGLVWAHLAIRRDRAPLPSVADVTAATAAPASDRPVALHWINTASQAMPRSAVLDAKRDPDPTRPFVMSYPAFVLEWADGRLLLIDLGMSREGALDFGRPIEWLAGGAAIEPHGSVAERLGAARSRVAGVIFTHLHIDHVGGLTELCAGLDRSFPVLMTEAQTKRPNFTTRPGLRVVTAARCARPETIASGGLVAAPGFPGVYVIAAGGHTPGSQIIVARVEQPTGARNYVFTGDTVNNLDGILHEVPKPLGYRLLIVPEDEPRQAELRRFLRELHDTGAFTLLVSHDQLSLEKSGIEAWR